MSSKLDELKEVLANDSAAAGFYTATIMTRVIDGRVHSIFYCDLGKSQDILRLTLGQVLDLDYSHTCMEKSFYALSGSSGETPSSLMLLLKLLSEIPHFDDFTSSVPSEEELKLFLKLFKTKFYVTIDGKMPSAAQPLLDWLNVRKGYPADSQSLMDVFLNQFSKVQADYLPTTENLISSADSRFDDEEQSSLLTHPWYVVLFPDHFTVYNRLWDAQLDHLALDLAFREHQAPGSNISAVPLKLFRMIERLDASVQTQRLGVKEKPSPERLLTAEMLCSGDMTLSDAWLTSSKLV